MKNMKEDLYLKEDLDIFSKIEQIKPATQSHILEIQKAEVDAILRNRKSLVDSSKSTDSYSDILLGLTILQIFMMGFQIVSDINKSNDKWQYLILFIASIIVAVITINKFVISKKKKNE